MRLRRKKEDQKSKGKNAAVPTVGRVWGGRPRLRSAPKPTYLRGAQNNDSLVVQRQEVSGWQR
jgi:hypothetical protein